MRKIHVREIANTPVALLWEQVVAGPETICAVFDDGEVITNNLRLVLSWYGWWIYREPFDIPVLMSTFIGNKHILDKTFTNQFTVCGRLAYNSSPIAPSYIALKSKENLCILGNDAPYYLGNYVGSASGISVSKVMEHPWIWEANQKIQSYDFNNNPADLANAKHYIDENHAAVKRLIDDHNELPNELALRSARAGTTKFEATAQCIGARGRTTEIDGTVFLVPVKTGIIEGLTDLAGYMSEARVSAKALDLQKNALKEVQYGNRQIQLICGFIAALAHDEDCGTTRYINWFVSEDNLGGIEGAWYLNETTNELECVTGNSRHLIGKTIKMRSAVLCQHPNPTVVCGRCYGELRHNLPDAINVGLDAGSEIMSQQTQLSLSHKHFAKSASIPEYNLTPHGRSYFIPNGNNTQLAINGELSTVYQSISLILDKDQVFELSDVLNEHIDIADLDPARVANVLTASFELVDGDDVLFETVELTQDGRTSVLSSEFIEYIRNGRIMEVINGEEQYFPVLSHTPNRDIKVDLAEWDSELPIFSLPLKQTDTIVIKRNITNAIQNHPALIAKTVVDKHQAIELALENLYKVTSTYFDTNIALLSVILRTMLCQDPANGDYNLPAPDTYGTFATYTAIMQRRNVAATMAFEGQSTMLTRPSSYIRKVRTPHPFDIFMLTR